MRPKSIATVVVVLSGTSPGSSTPTEAVVISCSVSRGGISDRERTSVVFPTPNPPAINTLSGMRSVESACTKTLQEPLEDFGGETAVGSGGLRRQMDDEVLRVHQIAHQHAGDPDGNAEEGA